MHFGSDPLRVLIVGGGIAVGYGVAHRQFAIDARMSAMFAAATNRGVMVDNRADDDLTPGEILSSLGSAGSLTFDLVVVFPAFRNSSSLFSRPAHRRKVVNLIDKLREDCRARILLATLPPTHPFAGAEPAWDSYQRGRDAIWAAASRLPSVRVVDLPALSAGALETPAAAATYYEQAAASLVMACRAELDQLAPTVA